MAQIDADRTALLWRILRTASAADQLASRRYLGESVRLYEDAMASLPAERRAARVQLIGAEATDRERVGALREAIATAVRAEWASLVEESERFTARCSAVARGAAFLTGAVVLVAWVFSSVLRRDLAEGASWRASSAIKGAAKSGVLPTLRPFSDVPNYFFHTRDETNPHIDIDLGVAQTLRSVEVTNRIDCCTERARDLEVWVSDDGTLYRRVAVRAPEDDSRSFTADLGGLRARFVRLELPRREVLHLAQVRVFGR